MVFSFLILTVHLRPNKTLSLTVCWGFPIKLCGFRVSFFIKKHRKKWITSSSHTSMCWRAVCVLFPFDHWARIRISHTLAHYGSEAALASSGSGLASQLVAEMNVAQRESHPLGYLGPTLVDREGTGPESRCRQRWLFTGPGSPWEQCWWWILMGLMITLPMRLINIMKSYWACAAVCDE